jgi:hypothetical protein
MRHPARDSVFEMYEIHAGVEGLYSAVVGVDSLAPWLDAWSQGEVVTGVPGIDSILGPLDVTGLEKQQPALHGDHDFVLQFEVPANWYILRERLMRVPSVVDAGPWLWFIGGGNHLVIERAEERWRFRFSVAWGDCPSGCVNRHDWIFEVDDATGARFVRSVGDPLPPSMAVR